MKTNFFTQLNEISGGTEIIMAFKSDSDGKLTVSLHSKNTDVKDKAKNHIPPLVVTETPENLDEEFFEAISKPFKKSLGLLDGMKNYEAQLDKAEKETKAAKDLQEKEKKAKEEKKKKYDGLMKKAKELEETKEYAKAIGCLREALPFAEDKGKVEKEITAIKAKLGLGSLFDSSAAEPEPEVKTNFLADLDHKQETKVDDDSDGQDDDDQDDDDDNQDQ